MVLSQWKLWGAGQRRVAMNDAQRYRENAAECLSAAERRGSPYRTLSFSLAAYWLSLARQQEAVDGIRGNASEATHAAAGRARSEGSKFSTCWSVDDYGPGQRTGLACERPHRYAPRIPGSVASGSGDIEA
jgi:hypothetical protein